jgi:Amidohydrolase family
MISLKLRRNQLQAAAGGWDREGRPWAAHGADAGRQDAPLVLSSDYPCGPLDPLHNLRAAVDRRLPDGRTLQPDQALTPQEAVRAATVDAAASLGLGTPARAGLVPGEPADLVVCDGDPFTPATRVTQTWVAGTLAWPAPDPPDTDTAAHRPTTRPDLPAPATPSCNPQRRCDTTTQGGQPP